MKTSATILLPIKPATGLWYRVTIPRYLQQLTSTAHTKVSPSRFYNPWTANPQFATLYLAELPNVAEFEAQVVFGSSKGPGVPLHGRARGGWTVMDVSVSLSVIVDLSDPASQAYLDTSVQEMTGDWEGYDYRSQYPSATVRNPIGTAPTQALGEALYLDSRDLEGFLYISAKVPWHRNLVVFPEHLRPPSYVDYEWDDGGSRRRFRVDRAHPNGFER
jgi:hypothetical protein